MDDVSRAVVRIGGLEYTIRGKETEEYLHKVALYVDQKMREIEKTNFNLSTSMRAVLVSINLADNILKSEKQIEDMKIKMAKLDEENKILNEMLVQLEKENQKLKEAAKRTSSPPIYDVARSNRNTRR